MGDQYYVDEYDEEPDMAELQGYISPDEGDGDLAGFERPEMKVDFSTAVVVSNLPQVKPPTYKSATILSRGMHLAFCSGGFRRYATNYLKLMSIGTSRVCSQDSVYPDSSSNQTSTTTKLAQTKIPPFPEVMCYVDPEN